MNFINRIEAKIQPGFQYHRSLREKAKEKMSLQKVDHQDFAHKLEKLAQTFYPKAKAQLTKDKGKDLCTVTMIVSKVPKFKEKLLSSFLEAYPTVQVGLMERPDGSNDKNITTLKFYL